MIKKKILPNVNICGDLCWEDEDGNIHRDDDKPAFISACGTIEYYKHGDMHRDGGKPASILASGHQQYWEHGRLIKAD